MVTIDSVRAVAERLPRSYEVVVRGRLKFRVGQIVWLAFSRDETVMGFAFPKEERNWLIGGSPDKFMLPGPSDLRFNWVLARLAALDESEMRDLAVLSAGEVSSNTGRPWRRSPYQGGTSLSAPKIWSSCCCWGLRSESMLTRRGRPCP